MTTLREKDSQDSIPESNVEVTDITSSCPTVPNAAPETCNKSINTVESYLSDLTV